MEKQTTENKPGQDFILAEYEQVLITYRENRNVLSQIIAFLVVANGTILVFAFQFNNYYIFLAGAFLMYILYRANHRAVQITLPVVIRGLIIENQLGVIGLIYHTVLKIKKFEKFNSILKENKLYEQAEDHDEQLKRVNCILKHLNNVTLKFDFPFALSKLSAYLVILLGVIQLLLFFFAVLNNTQAYHLPFDLPDLSTDPTHK